MCVFLEAGLAQTFVYDIAANVWREQLPTACRFRNLVRQTIERHGLFEGKRKTCLQGFQKSLTQLCATNVLNQ